MLLKFISGYLINECSKLAKQAQKVLQKNSFLQKARRFMWWRLQHVGKARPSAKQWRLYSIYQAWL